MVWTTNTEVSQRITELIGEQETYFKGQLIDVVGVGTVMGNLPRYTLSELAPVLKKIAIHKGWIEQYPEMGGELVKAGPDLVTPLWLYHYLKVCELVACNGDANKYIIDLLQ